METEKEKRDLMIGEITVLIEELNNKEIKACLDFARGLIVLLDKQKPIY